MDTVTTPMYGWQDLPWKKLERVVFKLQKRIFKAEQRGDTKTVRKLQKLLLKSRAAKLLAVRRVTQDNQGKKTAGIDGVKSLKPDQRLALANDLTIGHKASPTRRVWIPKPGTPEKRPLGIPVMRDRAEQALAKLALEPQWEARFEPNSYGFRPGRSAWDAITAIHTVISLKAKYVLDTDIAKCFDRIDHQALLSKLATFPKLRRTIKAWLRAGVMEGLELTPTEAGTPQGGVISPLLANIALHGMETVVRQSFKTNGSKGFYPPILIRYADDFTVFHRDREVVEKCQTILTNWLNEMGLELKATKTRLTHTFEPPLDGGKPGFNFRGFHVRQYPVGKYKSARNPKKQVLGFKTIIKPSKEVVKRHYQKIKETIDRHRSSKQLDLMKDLTPIIWGWAGYFRTASSKRTFSVLDSRVYNKLRSWARRRHPDKPMRWVYHHYWRKTDGPIAFTLVGRNYRLRFHHEMPIRRHVKVEGVRSPFDGDWLYWSARLGKHPEVPTRVARLLKQQRGRCPLCQLYFKDGDRLEIDHILPKTKGGKDGYINWQLLHRHCHDTKTMQLDC